METMTTTIDWSAVEKGTEISVDGTKGVWAFQKIQNGEITVWGGSRDPNGVRSFRTFTADRCRIVTRRKASTRMQRSPLIPPPARKGRR